MTDPDALTVTLTEARHLGLLGPGPVEPHLRHAAGFAEALRESGTTSPPRRAIDLGSGAGLPGLVLAQRWPETAMVLLDAAQRRVDFLKTAIERCGLGGRVTTCLGRAETVGHEAGWRAGFDLVVARSFGGPAVTAECAAPLLEVGGRLVVSSAPEGGAQDRWVAEGLAELGLSVPVLVRREFSYLVLTQESRCPDRFARRVGVPSKRPLF